MRRLGARSSRTLLSRRLPRCRCRSRRAPAATSGTGVAPAVLRTAPGPRTRTGPWRASGMRRCWTPSGGTCRAEVHARNLFHMSAGMWDAWAAYDPDADGYFVDEKHTADDVQAAREEAISFAAYRILSQRYANAVGGADTPRGVRQDPRVAVLRRGVTTHDGRRPAALGNRIAATIDRRSGSTDGSNEANGYKPTDLHAGEPAAHRQASRARR